MPPGTTEAVPEILQDVQTEHQPMYRVLVHNDDKTPFDFVVGVIIAVFKKEVPDAYRITLEAHESGVALVVVESLERAELHVDQAHSMARAQQHPLKFTYEPET